MLGRVLSGRGSIPFVFLQDFFKFLSENFTVSSLIAGNFSGII